MKKTILITGASGNLGSVVLDKLVEAGHHVLATVLSPENAKALQSDSVDAIALDLTDESAVKAFVQDTQQKWEITAAILLAGGYRSGNFLKMDKATFQKMVAINFETAFYLVRELLPLFEKQGGGRFFLTGAKGGQNPENAISSSAYSFSKGLVFQLAELINVYGQDKSIDATVIVPSIIDTPANRQAMPNADFDKWVSPVAIADTIQFVLSDSGKQIRQSVIKLYNEA